MYPISDLPGAPLQMGSSGNQPEGEQSAVTKIQNSTIYSVMIGKATDPAFKSERVGLQLGRIFRDGTAATCPQKTYPGNFNTSSSYGYTALLFYNPNPTPFCLTINFDTGDCGTNSHSHLYQRNDGTQTNIYDPSNQSANYLGDVGGSLTQPYSVEIKQGYFEIVLTNTTNVSQCNTSFSFTYPNGEEELQTLLSLYSTKDKLCAGESATLSTELNASYLWSTGETTQQITVSPLETTIYSVTVTNASWGTRNASKTITVSPGKITANVLTQPTCNLPTSGVVKLSGLPTAGWELYKEGQEGIFASGMTMDYTITGLSAGLYRYKLKDTESCFSPYTSPFAVVLVNY